jgi:hypothetical protein
MTYTPSIGDLLICKKGIFDHVGVLIANDTVLQNTPEKGEHATTIEEFADGQTIKIQRMYADGSSVLSRARKILAHPKSYNAFFRNCEHTAWEVIKGIAKSPQFIFFATLAAIALIIYFATRD